MTFISGHFFNIEKAIARFEQIPFRMDVAIGKAIVLMALEVEKTAKLQMRNSHPRDMPTNAKYGEPPNVVTGNLRRSIKSHTQRVGFGTYTAQIGPTAVYGRALELGRKDWASEIKYPFMAPTAKMLAGTGRLSDIYRRAIEAGLRP